MEASGHSHCPPPMGTSHWQPGDAVRLLQKKKSPAPQNTHLLANVPSRVVLAMCKQTRMAFSGFSALMGQSIRMLPSAPSQNARPPASKGAFLQQAVWPLPCRAFYNSLKQNVTRACITVHKTSFSRKGHVWYN